MFMKENPGVVKIEKIKFQTSDIRNIFCSKSFPFDGTLELHVYLVHEVHKDDKKLL